MSLRTFTRSPTVDLGGGSPPAVLDPAGPYAGSITTLAWALFAIGLGVTLIVLAALWIALFGKPALKARLGGVATIWIAGIAFPALVLTALLVWGLSLTRELSAPIRGDEMRIRVTGLMWWWRVDYLDAQQRTVLVDANELHIPAGRPVVLELTSEDVIHNFWVPRLSGKLDMIPGRTNLLRLQADRPGVFGGLCAEYCGGPHALMGLQVVAHEPGEFQRWLAERQARAAAPLSAGAQRGERLFASVGCAACHRIAGTPYDGAAGPDLSHVGQRRTLGAGILPNNRGTLMGWIGNAQAIKPGNRMPAYANLAGEDLRALAEYLEAQR
ncbi:MAG TPA: cytochrome c oxidase subunit II [Caldimonas sp.]|jgi:cytochrome c oxidase subunit 2|nr:cytochrome c oxidase subunit II [Caldimonas sp.]HEX2542929.1 cytochrome c oxidase subunit II [Caldimonas sp.]